MDGIRSCKAKYFAEPEGMLASLDKRTVILLYSDLVPVCSAAVARSFTESMVKITKVS